MSYWSGLTVRTLGTLELDFDGRALHLAMKQSAKPMQLLLILLTAGDAGASRRKIMESLFRNESETDASNSLNVTVSRLRRILRESGLPEGKYIQARVDRYYFTCPFPLWVDAREAERLRQAADIARDANRTNMLYQLCDLYYGRFLPDLDGEDWVEIHRAHLQRIFRVSMEELLSGLEERGSYGEMLRLAGFAVQLFPLDEWQVWQQRALLALGRIDEARELFRQAGRLYRNELDVPVPEQMVSQLKFGVKPFGTAQDAKSAAAMLTGEDGVADGGGYLPLPSFVAAFRFMSGARESSCPSEPCCFLCSLVDEGEAPAAAVSKAMDTLERAIRGLIGPSDAYTCCSRSQFLVMVSNGRSDACRAEAFAKGVRERFATEAARTPITLTCERILPS